MLTATQTWIAEEVAGFYSSCRHLPTPWLESEWAGSTGPRVASSQGQEGSLTWGGHLLENDPEAVAD